jgi:hypothetical protein
MIAGKFASTFEAFILKLNSIEQKDKEEVIKQFCQQLENDIYAAIKDIVIVIPPGIIQVQGSPGAQANIIPITLKQGIVNIQ